MFKLLKNNSGMTIISVVVAFGILVTACILFTKSMQFATNMVIMADDEKDGLEDSVAKYYNEKATETTSGAILEFKDSSDHVAFSFSTPIANTKPKTKASGKPEEYHYGFEFFYTKEPETVPPAPEGA